MKALAVWLLLCRTAFAAPDFADRSQERFGTRHNGSSIYRLYAAHLSEQAAPFGLLVYLHGDGADEFAAGSNQLDGYAAVARKHRLLMIAPLTPDHRSRTWWRSNTAPRYAAELIAHISRRYAVDTGNIWLAGYSGGAEVITYHLLADHSHLFHGGGALMVGGGGFGEKDAFAQRPSETFKSRFALKWLAGEYDTPAKGGSDKGFDALNEARQAYRRYRAAGFTDAEFEVVPATGHYRLATHGPAALDKLIQRQHRKETP
ncbi:hypothetical protein [Neisseria sp. 83E34]|uniref:hypothetical protein n=1 Tax=Neisseria sp. 83E34 TaxID=1692264 RepID=UPI0006CE92B2|nr:hypothetical protein [Neisseria sp. 83E34]KPN72134.1 hypothetical protein AKG09_02910 [Neisseria sp. 83E34]